MWEDFRTVVAGEWAGYAATCDPKSGELVALPRHVIPDAFKEYGVDVKQWATRSSSTDEGPGGIAEVDAFALQTRYLYPEAGCDFGREDVARTKDDVLLAGGQMGKMCIVDGDYCDGPLVLPPCEPGARATVSFGFAARVPEDLSDREGSYGGPIKLDLGGKETKRKPPGLPPFRVRVEVTIEAVPGANRDWRAASVEVISEARVDAGEAENVARAPDIESAQTLGEDDLAAGNWRAVGGVTFLTCESLLNDADFEDLFRDEAEKREAKKAAAAAVAERLRKEAKSAAGEKEKAGRRVGRGKVKRNGKKTDLSEEEEAAAATTEAEAQAKASAEEAKTNAEPLRKPRPPPSGLIVVPTWAVQAKASFSSAYEYVVGGNSPLVLLPMRAWCLVESLNDEVLVEAGIFAGEGGLGEGGWDMRAAEGGESEPRRVIARRYERGGRFASAFFVEESRMTAEELEAEKGEGEGGNPLYF